MEPIVYPNINNSILFACLVSILSNFQNQNKPHKFMATPNNRLSLAMERTGQWVFSQDIPTDVIVEVGETTFSLHKFMLVAKSNYIRKLILESDESELTRIDLSDIPGGPSIFEKTAKFCYGVNFEITVHNVAVLRCAAEFLQMTDQYCENNLAGRTEEFLTQVAFFTLTGAVTVLKSCRHLLPYADDINVVKRCVEAVSAKACSEANFPSRSPPNWWTEELALLDIDFFARVIDAMKQRSAKALTVAAALITYTERALRDLVRDHTGNGIRSSDPGDSDSRSKHTAEFKEPCSAAMQRVVKTVDAYLSEIAAYGDLSISKFNGIATLIPKSARKIDDDLYRAVDIYLKAHPQLDEIEREKVCSVMDPLKLSYEARVHASQNKRLPVQIVLHALYYDQLRLRSGAEEREVATEKNQLQMDVTLVRENEELRTELMKMKMYISDLQQNKNTNNGANPQGHGTTSSAANPNPKKATFFSSVSKTLGKLNPFRNGSKDTTHLEDGNVDLTKPRRRRFSVS
eukprot:XP_006591739.1 root phototropism protein 2 [Glycine max]